jgi:ABC-2 type transport system permease protein
VLPLTALMLGTSVLGDELEDGTAVFLLTKPVPRWQILFPKAAGAFLVTAAICASSTFVACSLAGASNLAVAFAIGVLAAAFAYTLLFVLLSVVTTRALISGLVYVFLWEGAITAIFEGLRYLSVRHYALGIADALADVPANVFDAYLSGGTAVALLVIFSCSAAIMANRRLQRAEVREPS